MAPLEANSAESATLPTTPTNDLPSEDLDILGERVIKEREYGPPIHEQVAVRTLDIISVGLMEKEVKEYCEVLLPPENCKLIDPPKINIEATIKDQSLRERERKLYRNQRKACASLSAIQQGINILLNQNKHFEKISEVIIEQHTLYDIIEKMKKERADMLNLFVASNILSADLQHELSLARRGLALSNMYELSEFVKDAIKKQTKIDEYLFGTNLADIIKSAKVSENARKSSSFKGKGGKNFSKNGKAPFKTGQNFQPSGNRQHTMGAPAASNNNSSGNNQQQKNRDRSYRRSRKAS